VSEIEIRSERPGDIAGIRAVVLAAFPTDGEADLVDCLRADGSAVFSLVAVRNGTIVGHVMLSKMASPPDGLGLAPVAVLSDFRRQGIAARLIEEALSRARAGGWKAAFVLGSDYYRRFGFEPSFAAGYASRYSGPHLQGLALQSGVTAGRGPLDYARAFADLD